MNLKHTLIGAVVGAFITLPAFAADVTTLRAATWLPPSNPQNTTVWPTWAKWVEEATEGRVKVVVEDYTGHPKTLFSAVEDGILDVASTVNTYLPGRFKLPSVAEIPGEISSAEGGSVALWKTYQEYFVEADEYDGLKVLSMFVHGPGQMHTKFPVNTLADMKGKKMRIGGGLVNELAARLEVTPVNAPATKSYEMLQQGVVDGTFLPAQEQKALRLTEVTTDLTLFPKGLYTTAFTIFMNPDFFEGLSPEDQEAIMSVSGEKLARLAGSAWGAADAEGIATAKEAGIHVVELSPDDPRVVEMHKLAEGIDQQWIKDVADRKVDAAAALAAFRKYVAEEEEKAAKP
ncbi:MAG: TRAP transporter substrate-binding protein [Thiothrix sp.]|nr:TRAP transporter substrate-binding protein [Thiothrix sp.]HPQ95541.1 TRAP transporter substrate-binding protein [Thiolinea sp.]